MTRAMQLGLDPLVLEPQPEDLIERASTRDQPSIRPGDQAGRADRPEGGQEWGQDPPGSVARKPRQPARVVEVDGEEPGGLGRRHPQYVDVRPAREQPPRLAELRTSGNPLFLDGELLGDTRFGLKSSFEDCPKIRTLRLSICSTP